MARKLRIVFTLGVSATGSAAGIGSLGAVVALLTVLAQSEGAAPDTGAFLGDDLLPYLVLALGGALVAGNLAAIFRPPPERARKDGDLEQAPIARSVVMAVMGAVAAIWALASLVSG